MKSILRFIDQYRNRATFALIHVTAFSVFLVPFYWFSFWLFVVLYYVGMFAISICYHRLLSHNSYGCNRWFWRLPWTILACANLQKGPLWWGFAHRDHHKFSDTSDDRHSPLRTGSFWNQVKGLWWGHIGWVVTTREGENDFAKGVPDLYKCWEMRLLEKYHYIPAIALAIMCFGLGWWHAGFSGAWSALAWGFLFKTVVGYHMTFLVNSACHWSWFGSRQFDTPDASRNIWWLFLFIIGENWHNDHHHQQGRAKQGIGWYKPDPSYYLLWVAHILSFGRLVWGLHKPARRPKEA